MDINFASKCLISEIHVHCSRIDLKLCEYHRLARAGARGSEINFAEMQLVLRTQLFPLTNLQSQFIPKKTTGSYLKEALC